MSGNHKSSVSSAAYLETLELYLRLEYPQPVADLLNVTGATVRRRLNNLGINLRPTGRQRLYSSIADNNDMEYIARLRRQLRSKAIEESEPSDKVPLSWGLSATQALETLELYFELQGCGAVGKRLRLPAGTVAGRLRRLGVNLRPPSATNVRVEDVNDMEYIATIKKRLRDQIAAEKVDNSATTLA